MTENLFIFDLMPFVHAGHVNKRSHLDKTTYIGASWQTLTIATGGVSLLFNELYNVVGKGDIVVASDRNPTIKKDMLPAYKGTRTHDTEIQIEKASAEYILQQCNVQLFARAGYEADDIIYTLIQKLHEEYEHIYVYTGDSDMYFLVDDKVTIRPSSSRAKLVTRQNYCQVAVKGGTVYNLSTMIKILQGDTSDNIPPLPAAVQREITERIYKPYLFDKFGNKLIVRELFKRNWPDYVGQVDLVFPLDVEDLPLEFSEPDKQMICNFGEAIHNSKFRGLGNPSFDVEPHIDALIGMGAFSEEG